MMKKTIAIPQAILCMAGLLSSAAAHAEALPLWELGLGVAGISLPDYRGSDERSTYVLPAPYFVYRGKLLKADRNGVRSMLFDSDRVDITLGLNATLPVNSRNNAARAGMENLKPSIEVGPTMSVNLWKSSNEKMKLDFRAPLRTAITVESSPRQIGWLFSPNLNLDVRDPAGFSGWNLGLLGGILVNSRKNNAYFYSVDSAEATATRPAYAAPGGYAGSQFTMALSKRFPRYWVGGFVRYDSLAGAVFEDSPLVKKRSSVWAGFAISWIFSESSRMVTAED
ncbi:MipA/OmpV family protein [Noviherbaspirillum massiliense]|uniref:MipA/OmpV family protein n=1 Tax=Noviherbaspirillum massiliense TaxID=1465823 RepID=UPI0003154F5C|nr:MipA/OmpV family protein [Noviherbaspirillum massiliense]